MADIVRGAANSSFPTHLIEQIEPYLASTAPIERVLVHADLTPHHVFVEGGRLTAIIDWGTLP